MIFTGIIDYYATGEGRTVWFAIFGAKDSEHAKEKFRTFFHDLNGDAGWKHFSLGLELKEGTHTEAEMGSDMGALSQNFTEWTKANLPEFYYRVHFNFS